MTTIRHKFVGLIPEVLEDGVLYISYEYCTAIHKCVCGCGNEVVTPISPNDWKVGWDGKSISLSPSIGNWNFDCKSHYWIINCKITRATHWSDEQIKVERAKETTQKQKVLKKNEQHAKK